MLEVLPYIFVENPSKGFPPNGVLTQAKPRFIQNPLVDTTLTSEEDFRVSAVLFAEAIDLLATSMSQLGLFNLPGSGTFNTPVDLPVLLAYGVHLYQVDKLGVPYIDHPRHVSKNAEIALAANPASLPNIEIDAGISAAWLHDVLEDSGSFFYRTVTDDDLSNWGISDRVCHLVDLLTRKDGVSDEVYYSGILTDSIARSVKLADIAHNLNIARVKYLNDSDKHRLERKYKKALSALGYHPEVDSWFQPLVDQADFPNRPYSSFESAEAAEAAYSDDELTEHYVGSVRPESMESAPRYAFEGQSVDYFADTPDIQILWALLWQFYLLEFKGDFSYNPALIAEFYKRKNDHRNSKLGELISPSSTFYPLVEITIPEIIKRAKRAKANLEFFAAKPKRELPVDQDSQERRLSHYEKLELAAERMDRDSAAEMLFLAFCEFGSDASKRIQIYDIKTIIGFAINRINR
jgi:hypothetical protein